MYKKKLINKNINFIKNDIVNAYKIIPVWDIKDEGSTERQFADDTESRNFTLN